MPHIIVSWKRVGKCLMSIVIWENDDGWKSKETSVPAYFIFFSLEKQKREHNLGNVNTSFYNKATSKYKIVRFWWNLVWTMNYSYHL